MRVLFIILITTLSLCSCSSSKELFSNGNATSKQYNLEIIEAAIAHRNNSKDSAFVQLSVEFPTSNNVIKAQIDSVILINLADLYVDVKMEPLGESSLHRVKDYFFSEFNHSDTLGNMAPWNLHFAAQELNRRGNYLNYATFFTKYTGGVQESVKGQFYVFDLGTSKQVNIEEICLNISTLEKRLEKLFRQQFNIAEGMQFSDAGFWFENNVFQLTRNFRIDEEFITFIYNELEIGPAVFGSIRISLPIKDNLDIIRLK